MEQVKLQLEAWGMPWKIAIIALLVISVMIYLDIIISNKIRIERNSLIGLLIDSVCNFYVRKKSILKAKSRTMITNKVHYVVPMFGRVYVINRYQKKKINKLMKQKKEQITIDQVLKHAIYIAR